MCDFGYGKFYPIKLKSETGLALQGLIQDVGIPQHIHLDGAKEMMLGTRKQVCRDSGIKSSQTERFSMAKQN
jgi:hypothetical protein